MRDHLEQFFLVRGFMSLMSASMFRSNEEVLTLRSLRPALLNDQLV